MYHLPILRLANSTVTEAGFGSDLGGEKFLDFKVPLLGKAPDTIVIVATVRTLKMHGGLAKTELTQTNLAALENGLANLGQHLQSMQRYGVPIVVAINQFTKDAPEELSAIQAYTAKFDVPAYVSDVWGLGGLGATDLAQGFIEATEKPASFKTLYDPEDAPLEKLNKIAQTIYGAENVELSDKAQGQLKRFAKYGWDKLPIIMAKTQYSLSNDAKKLGATQNFTIHVREFVPKLGAGFLVAMTGSILTMPGLPKHPAAYEINIDKDGTISGLF